MKIAAYMPKWAFAMHRQDYIKAAAAYMKGGLGEYLKAEVARANQYMTYVPGWEDEVDSLIDSAFKDFLEDTGLKGKQNTPETKLRALEEAIRSVKAEEKWNYALTQIGKQLKKPQKDLVLPDKATVEAAFWLRVRALIDDVFRS